MSYGDDFASLDPAAAPLDPTILIGADPMFWGGLLLALLVAALIGWVIRDASRSKRSDAAGPIWEAINDAATAAMKADTDSLPAHAAHLQRVLRDRLGKTLEFGGQLNRRVDDLERAIRGEAGDAGGRDGRDDPAGEDAPAAEQAAAVPTSAAAANVTIVSVHPTAPTPPASTRPGQDRRAMSTRERNNALRLAVAEFNDYWRHRTARENDMRAVVAELSNPGPRRPHTGHSGAHH